MTANYPASPPPGRLVVNSLREVLLHELRQRAVSLDPGEGPIMYMEVLARRLVQMAIGGNLAAIKEIHDRCDGKVASAARSAAQSVPLRWVDEEDAHGADV